MNATAQNVIALNTTDSLPPFEIKLEARLLPETITLLQNAPSMLRQAQAITIADDSALDVAADQLQRIKGAMKSIDDQRKAVTAPIDAAKKKVMDYVKGPLESLTSAETLLKNAIIRYQDEQEQKRLIAEAKAAEEARKESEKLQAKAEKLEASGKVEQAEALRENAAMQVAAPSPIVSAPKVSGVSTRKTYAAEVTDLMALCKSVAAQALLMEAMGDPAKLLEIVKGYAASNTPIQALAPDQKFLDSQAKAFKEAFAYPGCRLVTDKIMAARSKS